MHAADIVLGLGNDIDYEVVWDQSALRRLADESGVTKTDLEPHEITDRRSLIGSICGFIARGGGGERGVVDQRVIDDFVRHFEYRATMGGTAPRAAEAMSKMGFTGTLHLTCTNPTVRSLLPAGFDAVFSTTEERMFPHLIVQYPAGATIRLSDGHLVRADKANRLIYVHDDDNERMLIAPQLAAMVASARIVLVSGLNAMASAKLLGDRLLEIERALSMAAPGAVTVLEEAAYHDETLGQIARSALSPRMTVHSMSGEELPTLAGYKELPTTPAELMAQVEAAHTRLRARNIVVHAPAWALAHGPQAAQYKAALDFGLRLATARYQLGDAWQASDAEALKSCAPTDEGELLADWAGRHRGPEVAVVPGRLVNVASPTTIGLGDTFIGGFIGGIASSLT
ncbi:MAG: ADP-dependent glucokinase/phosphofructokinase [Propionibacteriaceae bacterium]|nr:ADP-dependent glucokinase/phosphofructokinase [Propionibacteriaceae bacterium]